MPARSVVIHCPRAVVAVLGLVVIAIAHLASGVPSAHANATQYGYFQTAYPSSPLAAFSSTAPSNSCLVCHPTTSGPASPSAFFNVYGTAFAALPHSTAAAAIASLHSIESANSDSDGPTIAVSKAGTGSGTVTSAPGGIDCGGTCTASFTGVGSAITLTATPAAGSTFAGWSGGGTPSCSGTGTCTVRSDNITEINLGSFPGNSASRPTINVTAMFTAASFNYSLGNSGNIVVLQGAAGSTTITATLTAGATQSVAFDISGLPAGATRGFSTSACSPTCTTQLTITTSAATPTGTFPITVTGNPLGRTTIVNLVVNPPAPSFNYSLGNSGNVVVPQGGAGSTTITATLTAGTTQSVAFDTSGLPAGATRGFSTSACNPTCTTQLTITTAAATPTGTFPITVTGNPLGKTTTVNLSVGLPPAPDLVVTQLTAPTAGTIGGMIEGVSATVRNQGSAVTGNYRVGFYYSTDPSITSADVFSGTFCNMPPLNPGQSRSCDGPVAVPASLSPGTFYLGAFVDDLQAVPEADEQNNARAADTGPITLTAAGAPALSLSLNQMVFAAGDVLSLKMTTQTGVPTVADIYLILVIPGGTAYSFDGAVWALIFDGTHVIPGAVKSFRASAMVTTASEVIFGGTVPGSIPHGPYRFLVVLVRAGTDPLDTSNWLTAPGQANFSF